MGIRSSKKQQATPEKPASRISEQDKAVLQLKQMRDKLKQYQRRVETQIEREHELARELVKKGNKAKALLLLKKKKFLENNLNNTDKQLDNLEQMVHSIEFKQIEIQVVNGLKVGSDALKNLNQMLNLDDIEQIMDDTKEAADYQNRITELISGQFSQEDEVDINMELDSIIDELLPALPEDEIPKAQKEKGTKKPEKEKRVAALAD